MADFWELLCKASQGMIVVIADDLTGAAELAGAAAGFGLTAEIQTSFEPDSRADVIAIDTNSRGMPSASGARHVARITCEVLKVAPQWIYKKTDSVLRGNVRAEIEAILGVINSDRAVLIPANPSKGRIIQEGVYYLHGTPLANTAFALDPEHPRRSSRVLELLGDSEKIRSIKLNESLPPVGIAIPDVKDGAELTRRAVEIGEKTLAAGGVEFFQALLTARFGPRRSVASELKAGGPTLFVCGSAHAWNQGRAAQCERASIPTVPMLRSLYSGSKSVGAVREWAGSIATALSAKGQAMAAIGRDPGVEPSPESPAVLVGWLAEAVAEVLRSRPVARVYLEGGATAASLLRTMNWTRLNALAASSLPGVAASRAISEKETPLLLMKPGSYPWPEQVWNTI